MTLSLAQFTLKIGNSLAELFFPIGCGLACGVGSKVCEKVLECAGCLIFAFGSETERFERILGRTRRLCENQRENIGKNFDIFGVEAVLGHVSAKSLRKWAWFSRTP
ncbi:MAG: hypothetical protein ABF623_08125 [Gluconobacter cerinus]|uniref:hypothetical protein n=1 Tax=Gluconobacter cerinus TaxID=38307 RepID=UPI0039E7303D